MAKGSEAKLYINNKLREIFGSDYLGEMGGKIYINAPEAGTKVQIAISMTCPKIPYMADNAFDMVKQPEEIAKTTTEITEDERNNIKSLLEELGL